MEDWVVAVILDAQRTISDILWKVARLKINYDGILQDTAYSTKINILHSASCPFNLIV